MARRQFDGTALGALATGTILLYAGIKGYSIPHVIQGIVQKKGLPPPGTKPDYPIQQSAVQNTQSGPPGGAPPVSTAPSSTTPAVSGGTFTHAQLMTLWTANGGDPNAAQNAACHAIQESSGESWVTSANPDGGTNVGLWQLDTKGKGAGYSIAQLQNPDLNARITVFATRNGSDWSAWATPGC
jgi:hypothetical protein